MNIDSIQDFHLEQALEAITMPVRRSQPTVQFSEVIDCLSIGDSAPTESGGDSGQNCLDYMSIVGNT